MSDLYHFLSMFDGLKCACETNKSNCFFFFFGFQMAYRGRGHGRGFRGRASTYAKQEAFKLFPVSINFISSFLFLSFFLN